MSKLLVAIGFYLAFSLASASYIDLPTSAIKVGVCTDLASLDDKIAAVLGEDPINIKVVPKKNNDIFVNRDLYALVIYTNKLNNTMTKVDVYKSGTTGQFWGCIIWMGTPS